LDFHRIDPAKAAQIVALIVEGVSLRAIARLTDADRNTVGSLLLTAGGHCQKLFDERVRGIHTKRVQLDELWTYVFKHEKRLKPDDPTEYGDAYTWTALDSDTELMLSYLVGQRDAARARLFVQDLSTRVKGRCQGSSDGLRSYITAMEEYFGADVDFAQLVKLYGKPENTGPDWYGLAKVTATVPTPISGDPDPKYISTSHVERSNLTFRMHLRRFTRLTNGFSKRLVCLKAAVAIFMAWYNFARVHQTLRVTPAMEAGLTDHVWTIHEMLGRVGS